MSNIKSNKSIKEKNKFLTVLEHWSSDVSGVDEVEINSYVS
jgi:hypothetical protein